MNNHTQLSRLTRDTIIKAKVRGTHRSRASEETIQLVSRHMNAMGITRVANITGLDRIGIPVVIATRPNSRSLSVSQGKGIDLYAAKASALMESVESYHAERIDQPLLLGSYEDLADSHRLVECDALPRSRLNRFNPSVQLLWIEAYDLLSDESIWIPYELVHTNFILSRPTGSGCFYASSNGLASGNCLIEAINHAVCEVIERDATTHWYLLDQVARDATRLDPSTVYDEDCRLLLSMYDLAQIDVALWDATTDVGIPCFVCMIVDRDPHFSLYATGGMGCHANASIALIRALTEAAQSRLTMIAGSRDDVFPDEYRANLSPIAQERHRLTISTPSTLRPYNRESGVETDSFNEDLTYLLRSLHNSGIQRVLAVDLTRTEFGISVVRVIIPGLEGLVTDPNYYPGARAHPRS